MTKTLTQIAVLAVGLLMILPGYSAHAENQNDITSQLEQLKAKADAELAKAQSAATSVSVPKQEQASTPQLPQTPTLTVPPPVKPPSDDRSNKNGAAKALAMAGAAMAMMECMKLKAEAQKEPDPQMKKMLEMMANQQCQQGMKDMADALKNDDGKKTATSSDGIQMPQLTMAPFQAPKTDAPETPAVAADPIEETPAPFTELTDTPVAETPEAPQKSTLAKVTDPETPITKTTMEAIDTGALKLDNKPLAAANGLMSTGAAGAGLGSPSFPSSRPLSEDELKRLAELEKQEKRARAKEETEAGGSTDGDSGSSSGGGAESNSGSGGAAGASAPENDPLQAMLNQLMGGGGGGAEADAGGSLGGDIFGVPTESGTPNNTPAGVHLFQYASLLYRKFAHQENRLKLRTVPSRRGVASIPPTANLSAGVGLE